MNTIIYCHPYDKSFNHAILQAITGQFTEKGEIYNTIDLNGDSFNPVLDGPNLALYSSGGTADDTVTVYQHLLRQTDHLIIIFPIWWGMMPAILKGFIDKTFLKGIVYDTTPEGVLTPSLSIARTTLITTSGNATETVAPFIEGYFTPLVLNAVGINGVKWFNCAQVTSTPAEHRRLFLTEVLQHLAS